MISLDVNLDELDPETREKLMQILQARYEYSQAKLELDRLVLAQLAGSITAEVVAEYSETKLRPLRETTSMLTLSLLAEIDREELRKNFEMALSFMLSTLPLPLPVLLMAFGVDPDMVKRAVALVRAGLSDDEE